MKKFFITSVIAAMATSAMAATTTLEVTVNNPGNTPREAVPVTVNLAEVVRGMNVASATVVIDGKEVACQLDDLNKDGVPEELVWVTDVAPKSAATAEVTLSDEGTMKTFEPQTYAYIKLRDEKKKYPKIVAIEFPGDADTRIMYNSIYGHGAVMEGFYNAIRIYMDNRQSIDIYGKNKLQLELDVTGFYTTPEQLAEGYGHDILWAGKSVAAGSFRGYQNHATCYIDTVASRGQRVVVSGSVRSIVEVTDHGWIYNGKRHEMTQRYTLWAGHRDYDVDINIIGTTPEDVYATGVQKMESDNEGFVATSGLAACWGSNVPEKKYADLVEWVGLGVSVDPKYLNGVTEDTDNYLTFLRPDRQGNISYGVNMASVREPDGFKDAPAWMKYLNQWHNDRLNPCTVTIKKK
ncbi:MAG: DUF4861 domain-containing protein [Lachnoclostridium sp.]|nr:DUF4861 domain-containing protein [Lachnoclostridium sp.]